MQYTHPKIMYVVNRLYSYADTSSTPELQGIKHLICYLSGCYNHTILTPYGLDGTTTHELHQ